MDQVEDEKNKENNGVKDLNTGKRAKSGETPDSNKPVDLTKKETSASSVPKPAEEEEEVIDTSTKTKKTDTDGKRIPKPVEEEGKEETKVQVGTIKEMVNDAASVEEADKDENEFNMDDKLKEGDIESDEDKVSLEEENIDELQNEEEFDVEAYLKFRQKEGV